MSELHCERQDPRDLRLRLILIAVAATAIDICTRFALDIPGLTFPARLTIALMPLPGNIALLVTILQIVRALDEFQKRVQLEAVVVGFLATGVAVFVYGFLQRADIVGPLNMVLVWLFMLISYGIGYFVSMSHYK